MPAIQHNSPVHSRPTPIVIDPTQESERLTALFRTRLQEKSLQDALNVAYQMPDLFYRAKALEEVFLLFIQERPLDTLDFLNSIPDREIQAKCQLSACYFLSKKGFKNIVKQIGESADRGHIKFTAQYLTKS